MANSFQRSAHGRIGRYLALGALCSYIAFSQPLWARDCQILLSRGALESDLDEVLGPWKAFARERAVSIDPSNHECYLSIQIAVSLPLGGDCLLEACSVAAFQGQRIGLQAFDAHGCDALVDLFHVSRHVPTALADASEQIKANCGPETFEISGVEPVFFHGEARVRVKLRTMAP